MEGIGVQSPVSLCRSEGFNTEGYKATNSQQLPLLPAPSHPFLSVSAWPLPSVQAAWQCIQKAKLQLTIKQNLAFRFKLTMPYGITWWEGIKQDTTCTPRKCWELYWPPTPRLSTNSKSQLEFCTLAPSSHVSWCSHGFSSTLHLGFPRSHGRARTLRTPREKGKLIV